MTPFQGFRNFSFNLSSRIGPIPITKIKPLDLNHCLFLGNQKQKHKDDKQKVVAPKKKSVKKSENHLQPRSLSLNEYDGK